MVDYNSIKLIVLDVDGTLTDGSIYYDSQGNEIKKFNVKDGLGIKVALEAGLKFAILTGRKSPMVERRAKELGITYLLEGVQQKYPALMGLVNEYEIDIKDICYIGDDWNDLQCMNVVGLKMCPADAAVEIAQICSYVANAKGGCGAVRECLEHLLRGRKEWDKFCSELYETNILNEVDKC